MQETRFGKDTCRFIEGQQGALVMLKWFFRMLMVVSSPLSASNFPLSSAATIFPSCLQRVIASSRNVCRLPLLLAVCVCVWPPFLGQNAPQKRRGRPSRIERPHVHQNVLTMNTNPMNLQKRRVCPLNPPKKGTWWRVLVSPPPRRLGKRRCTSCSPSLALKVILASFPMIGLSALPCLTPAKAARTTTQSTWGQLGSVFRKRQIAKWHLSSTELESGSLVSQRSATRDTVAATPLVARHDFMIHAWPT